MNFFFASGWLPIPFANLALIPSPQCQSNDIVPECLAGVQRVCLMPQKKKKNREEKKALKKNIQN